MNSDKFWSKDIKVLYDKERIFEIFPTKNMTRMEKLNAISRLSILLSIILTMYNGNVKYMYMALIVLGLLMFMVKNDTLIEQLENQCQEPTINNPFMNVLMSDYTDNPERKAACPSNQKIKEAIEEKFNYNLYKNTDDLFNRNNSQRQFYTTPNTTIPNDQESFAKWLYKTKPTCKEESIRCGRNIHERLQQNRFEFPNPEENPFVSEN